MNMPRLLSRFWKPAALSAAVTVLAVSTGAAAVLLPAWTAGPSSSSTPSIVEKAADQKLETAIFAAGCFWCTEADFDKVDGVVETISGFIGGTTKNPTYKQVTSGGTGHTEAVKITYDASKVSYKDLLKTYWRNVDFFDATGQFCDRGSSYRPAIFAVTAAQKTAAKASKTALQKRFKKKVIVPVLDATTFTPADDYHQNFYNTNPFHYYRYRVGCGRDARLQRIWNSAS